MAGFRASDVDAVLSTSVLRWPHEVSIRTVTVEGEDHAAHGASLEGLDNKHPPTTARARPDEGLRRFRSGGIAGSQLGLRHIEQFAHPGEVLGAAGVSEQAIAPDAMQAFWQDVHEEAADELMRRERHGRISA
jgi:hypothetical protein